MNDLSSLTADQLAERVRDLRGGFVDPATATEAMRCLAELQTRANQHDAVERERDVLNDEANDLVRRAEAAEKERDEALMRLKREQAASDAESEALTIRMQQAEKERDEARADTQKVWDTLEREVKAREAAEKERDEARRGREQYGRMATEYRERAEAAEARLAETQEALEGLRGLVRETFSENRDGGWRYRVEPAEHLIRAALTTHPADD